MHLTFSDGILPSIIKKITKFLSSRTEFVVVISVYKIIQHLIGETIK